MENILIREACEEDCAAIVSLIKGLAVYEKVSADIVKISERELRNDGFGEDKFFNSFVAELKDPNNGISEIVGYALYYYVYSTWMGRAAQLEDLFVKDNLRGHGIGTSLLKAVAKRVREKGCKQLDLVCLNWNTPTIGYYKHLGAVNLTEKGGWQLFRFPLQSLDKLVNK